MISIDNIRYHSCLPLEFADLIFDRLKTQPKNKTIIVHVNLRNYYYLNKDARLKEEIRKNCMAVFEGIGLKAGLWFKGMGFLPDLNGTDLFPFFMEKISVLNLKVYLLGSEKSIIEKAAENIMNDYPEVKICGFHHGYFSAEEELSIVNDINESKADLLIIGRGFPLQENFVLKHKNELRAPLIWNVGGLFDIVSGYKPRAPVLVRKLRLEWMFRFLLEPRRMLYRNTVCAFWSLGHLILTQTTNR